MGKTWLAEQQDLPSRICICKHSSAFIKGVKCALSCLGICDDFMAEPFHRFRAEHREQIESHLADFGVSPGQRVPQ